ncbi:SAM-dependent methyltransferase [Actinomadura sp. NBRC 104425]|uniref:SAM-dependent methyltransferase n=1 Tax=Actinomadura sp. NBRC 104425 TaxID=3032204 RepID=UPI002556F3DC|nr:SAM-dependent methyltransferase [Actinomadura sp. NBRC 104425]
MIVALMLVAMLHFLTDDDDPYGILARLLEPLPPGSHVVITHATGDNLTPEQYAEAIVANERSGVPFRMRSRDEFARFFTGLGAAAARHHLDRRVASRGRAGGAPARRQGLHVRRRGLPPLIRRRTVLRRAAQILARAWLGNRSPSASVGNRAARMTPRAWTAHMCHAHTRPWARAMGTGRVHDGSGGHP